MAHCNISEERIRSFLPDRYKNEAIHVFKSVGSTNDLLRSLAQEGADDGTAVIASEQTAGRGRMGRAFHSPQGGGLYMSVLIRPKTVRTSQLATVAAAVAVCRAVSAVSNLSCGIKWVNDLYFRGKKICGILAEAGSFNNEAPSYIVIGIGVNCAEPDGGFPKALRNVAGSLGLPPEAQDPLAAHILSELLDIFRKGRDFIEEYRARSLVLGNDITYMKDGDTVRGTAVEINNLGNLVVRLAGGRTETLSSGEVSIDRGDYLKRYI